MPDVHVPLLGNVPKGGLFAGGLAVVGVAGYLWIRHQKTAAAEQALSTGQTPYAYGYGTETAGYYGYGYGYGTYGGGGFGQFSPYPFGSEYGYGAYGYGYYNPYTGQYLGAASAGGSTGPSTQPRPVDPPPHVGTHTITAPGTLDLYYLAKLNGIAYNKLLSLNPHLKYLVGSKKPVPRGTKVKV